MLQYLCSTQYITEKAGVYPHKVPEPSGWPINYINDNFVAPKYLEGFCLTQYKNTRRQVLTLFEVPKPSGYPLHL